MVFGLLVGRYLPKADRWSSHVTAFQNRLPWPIRGHSRESTAADVHQGVLAAAALLITVGGLTVAWGIYVGIAHR